MPKNAFIAVALAAALSVSAAASASAGLLGPGPWYGTLFVWGNDTGGIIPYSPAVPFAPAPSRLYRRLAANHCARYGRLSHITSARHRYGGYIGFVCIDRPHAVH
jgi:hypothetical protein